MKSDRDSYTVLITTSGLGSRLGQLTEYTNKALIVVGNKPAISYVIESYPVRTRYVITLGHFASHIKQFLTLVYPERQFEFIYVDPYQGPGSSLAFSMLQAKNFLQEPFIFHASDSILVDEALPLPSRNWVAGQKSDDATNYASFDVGLDSISRFHDKGMVSFDYLHIGIIGINDYMAFWNSLEAILKNHGENDVLNDLSALIKMLDSGHKFELIEVFSWLDIGNSHSLTTSQEKLSSGVEILAKPNESISFIKGEVIKFFSDSVVCQNRITRAKDLIGFVPLISGVADNFYKYPFVDGNIASKLKSSQFMRSLLDWAKSNLWILRNSLSDSSFALLCESFYGEKSQMRIGEFCKSRGISDRLTVINGVEVPSASDLINFSLPILMNMPYQVRVHGDFILDNIIVSEDKILLIDWRQDFGGSLDCGDLYYDFAKLNHSLHLNHEIVARNLFTFERNAKGVDCGILMKDSLVAMQKEFENWICEHGYDLSKIQILTAIIWINMAPLHHHPFDQFLYYYGRLNLWRRLSEKA